MRKDKDKIRLMFFGPGGNSGYSMDWKSHWYLKPSDIQRYIGDEDSHYPRWKMEGCILVDAYDILIEHPEYAYASPICDGSLEFGHVSAFPADGKDSAVFRSVQSSGGYAQLLTLCADVGGLDKVAVDVYAQWWRDMGARIGKVENGVVLWEKS